MLSAQTRTNNLGEFKKYLEGKETDILDYTNAIQYTYGLTLNLYNINPNSVSCVKVSPNQVMNNLGMGETNQMGTSFGMPMSMTSNEIWEEMLDNEELLKSQYNVLSGKWPREFNEVVLIVDEDNRVSDYTLYSLGLLDPDDLIEKYNKLLKGQKIEETEDSVYSYEELLDRSFKLILNTDYYVKSGNMWKDMSEDEEYMSRLLEEAEEIKIVRNYKTK